MVKALGFRQDICSVFVVCLLKCRVGIVEGIIIIIPGDVGTIKGMIGTHRFEESHKTQSFGMGNCLFVLILLQVPATDTVLASYGFYHGHAAIVGYHRIISGKAGRIYFRVGSKVVFYFGACTKAVCDAIDAITIIFRILDINLTKSR